MKRKFKQIGRSTLSVVLSFMMIISTVLVGNIGSIDASATQTAIESDGTAIMYFIDPASQTLWGSSGTYDSNNNWYSKSSYTQIYLFRKSGNTTLATTWVTSVSDSGLTDSNYPDGRNTIKYFVLPEGTWTHFIVCRVKDSGESWNYVSNKSPDITLDDEYNYLSSFTVGGKNDTLSGYNLNSTKLQTSTSALSIDGSNSASISANSSVTLTTTITNTTYNTIKSSATNGGHSYSVKENGVDADSSKYSINYTNNTITFSEAGTYTVTDKVTYNAKGFAKIYGTATSNAVTVEVTSVIPRDTIGITAKKSDNGTTYTPATGESVPTATLTFGGTSVTNKNNNTISGVTGDMTVELDNTSYTVGDDSYSFVGWTTDPADKGVFGNLSASSTTFTPNDSNVTVVAKFAKSSAITVSQDGGSNTFPANATVGSTVSGTITPPSGKSIDTVTATDASDGSVTVTNTSGNNYQFTMPASAVTVNVTYTDKTTYTLYFHNTGNWEHVYAYAWHGAGESDDEMDLKAWPGTEVTTTVEGHSGYYTLEVNKTAEKIIFHNGSDNTGKTGNLDIVDNGIYSPGMSADATIPIYSEDPQYYIIGRMIKSTSENVYTWNSDLNADYRMTQVGETSIYKYNTGLSLKTLTDYRSSTNSKALLFCILKSQAFDEASDRTQYNVTSNSNTAIPDKNSPITLGSGAYSLNFSGTVAVGTVAIFFNSSTGETWYEIEGAAPHSLTKTGDNTANFNLSKSTGIWREEEITVTASAIPSNKRADVIVSYTENGTTKTIYATRDGLTNNYKFKMPEADATVNVVHRAPYTYTVTAVADTKNGTGTVTLDNSALTKTVTEGESVTATAVPGSKYHVEWEYSNENFFTGKTETSTTTTIYPTTNTTVTAVFVENTTALPGNTKLFAYNTKPDNATKLAAGTSIPLVYNEDGEIYAKFTVGITEDLSNSVLESFQTYAFTYSSTGNMTSITSGASNANDAPNDGWKEYDGTSMPGSTDYADVLKFENNSIDGTFYNFFMVKPNDAASEIYLYIGTYNNGTGTVTFNSQSERFIIKGTSEVKAETIPFYAKTGTIRKVTGSANNSEIGDYSKFAYYTDIKVEYVDDNGSTTAIKTKDSWEHSVAGVTHYRLREGKIEKNRTVKVTATIFDETAKSKYYIKGFNINGKTEGLVASPSADGVYTCTFTANTDTGEPYEITPVYFYKDDSKCVTFKVEGYDTVSDKWGNTVAAYVWYVNGTNVHDNSNGKTQYEMGGYPGQPLLKIGGTYTLQVPLKDEKNNSIKGVTMNNYVWDAVHGNDTLIKYKSFNGLYDSNNRDRENTNAQSYDYDDFLALSKLDDVSTIVFKFKQRTGNSSTSDSGGNYTNWSVSYYNSNTGSSKNNNIKEASAFNTTWETLVDYDDIPVDLFGNRIVVADADLSKETITQHENFYLYDQHYYNDSYILSDTTCADTSKYYVVSDGYWNYYKSSNNNTLKANSSEKENSSDYLGEYATLWTVYKKTSGGAYYKVGALPPSAFITKDGFIANLADSYFTDGNRANGLATGTTPPAAFLDYTIGLNSSNPEEYAMGDSARQLMWNQYVALYNECFNKPVVINYEASLKSEGTRDGASSNVGYRTDGRWYYSRANDKTNILADIKVLIRETSGSTITYVEDAFETPNDDYTNHTGVVTNADARFVNPVSDLDYQGYPFNGKVRAIVERNENKNFIIEASPKVKGYSYSASDGVAVKDKTPSDVEYKFVGWYMELGDNELTYLTDDNYFDERDMGSKATLIAVYEAYTPAENAKTLTVYHDLYANRNKSVYAGEVVNKPDYDPAVTNSTNGVTYVSVVVTDSAGNKHYYNNKAGAVTIDDDLIGATKIEITLHTKPGTGVTPVATYRYANSGSDSTSNYTPLVYTDSATGRTTYTYDGAQAVSALFGEGNSANLYYFTNLSVSQITVNFKYYDRVISHNTPANIKATPSTITYKTADISGDKSITTAVTDAFVSVMADNDVGNVVDDYKMWPSQQTAVSSFKTLPDFRTPATENAVEGQTKDGYMRYEFSTFYKTVTNDQTGEEEDVQYTPNFGYHTDRFGMPVEDGSSADKWVTYYDSTNREIRFTTDEQETAIVSTNKAEVSYVTVWLFNTPHEYTVKVQAPQNATEILTQLGETGLYYSNTTPDLQKAFYNQRLGGIDNNPNGANAGSNNSVEYLTGYGIDKVYNTEINPPEKVTNNSTVLVFDGWYSAEMSTAPETPNVVTSWFKVSSDRRYGNRVTSDMNLVAAYRVVEENEEPASVGVSVIDNGIDYYVDNNSDVKKVRLNTMLNVYNTVDSDPKIKQVSAIYVRLPSKITVSGTERPFVKTDLTDELKSSIITKLRNQIYDEGMLDRDFSKDKVMKIIEIDDLACDEDGKIISYTYNVGASEDPYVTLTNKNRTQFVLPMTASNYEGGSNCAILAFAAIRYDDRVQSLDENGAPVLDDNNEPIIDGDNRWILSDNFVPYIYYDTVPD